jgi:dihydroorotase-like cyclic amidohydrolase
MRNIESGNMKEAWAGLSGLQYQLPATWAEARERKFTEADIARWWSENPSKLAGLFDCIGSTEVGKQANYCWWDIACVEESEKHTKSIKMDLETQLVEKLKNIIDGRGQHATEIIRS